MLIDICEARLPGYPIGRLNGAAAVKSISGDVRFPTASAAVDRMIEAGILQECSGKRTGRLCLNGRYLDILSRESQAATR